MKIALVYNVKKSRCQFDIQEVKARFAQAGHEIVSVPENQEWDDLIAAGFQRLLVAGGDGTVEAVLPHLIGRQMPFCVIPCGTGWRYCRFY